MLIGRNYWTRLTGSMRQRWLPDLTARNHCFSKEKFGQSLPALAWASARRPIVAGRRRRPVCSTRSGACKIWISRASTPRLIFGTTVFLSLPFLEDHDLACAIAHGYNTWLDRYCKTSPQRLKGIALVAMQEPKEAVKELERCIKELGFVGVATSAHSAGRNLDHPDFYPFYAKAQELGVPVCVHVGSGRPAAAAERFNNAFFVHATTHAFEQMIGVMCIVGGGILELYPKLKVAFLEAGAGWVPYWMERLDEHYEYLQPTVPLMKKPPSDYMRSEQVYYSFEPDEHTLNFVMNYVGEDRLVFASDYNHGDSKFPHTVASVTERKDLSTSQLRKLMYDNAARLYNI